LLLHLLIAIAIKRNLIEQRCLLGRIKKVFACRALVISFYSVIIQNKNLKKDLTGAFAKLFIFRHYRIISLTRISRKLQKTASAGRGQNALLSVYYKKCVEYE